VTDTVDSERAAAASPAPDTAGTRLRAAREAAGLSIESVAQQLKLAPRQVRALEDDDFQRLPGRTFVRGFARNYARFLQLDPDTVVGLLPASESAPALQRPSLTATRQPMGEMPSEGAPGRSAARWLLPMLIVLVVAAAAYYEYQREHGRDPFSRSAASAVMSTGDSPPAPTSAGTSTTALPKAQALPGSPANAEPRDGSATPAATGSTASPATPATPAATTSAAPLAAVPSLMSAPGTSGAAPATAPSDTGNSQAALILAFKGTSWAEVKDASGRVILQMTGGAGMTQTVNGTAPFELALGNAPDVAVTFRGQSLDLAPYTRGSVARVALR
jgi:cytoskeleton protein RodZ